MAVAFSPDGQLLLTVCAKEVRVYQTDTRELVGEPLRHPLPENQLPRLQPRLCAAFSPDGKNIVTGGEDGTARMWKIEDRGSRIEADLRISLSSILDPQVLSWPWRTALIAAPS